jgi:ABC-type Fe3+-siderophore transport system permease subunit
VILFLLALAVSALVVGGLGRLLVIGPDPMTLWETMALGLAASLISWIIVRLAFGGHAYPGLVLTVFVASLLVYLVRLQRRRDRG